MVRPNDTRVLAIGIDSADHILTRELIDRGEMPTLASLLERGRWAEVDAGADVGSDAVWPTFLTGSPPSEHESYYLWCWDPEAMACIAGGEIPAFWDGLVANGEPVGIFDVPHATAKRNTKGFDVSEWRSHHELNHHLGAHPAWARELAESAGKGAFQTLRETPDRFRDRAAREELAAACLQSAGDRADLVIKLMDRARTETTIVNFTEVHRAAHMLWRTVDPGNSAYAGLSPDEGLAKPDIRDLYREVDRQAGRVIDAAGPETAVVAFSLHGMQPTIGIPAFLEPLLVKLGFAAPTEFSGLSWRQRGRALFAAAKRGAPAPLRRLYHRAASPKLQYRLAQPTMVPAYAWSRTRAFAVPSDHHGYVRVNLAGREAAGIVPARDYGDTCDQLERTLLELRSGEGEPLVSDVLRPERKTGSPPEVLPDLIAHWTRAALAGRVRAVSGSVAVEAEAARTDRLGTHSLRGFCVVDGRLGGDSVGDLIAGQDLHRLLLGERAGAGALAS